LSQVNASEADDGYVDDLGIEGDGYRDQNDMAGEDDEQKEEEGDATDTDVDGIQLPPPIAGIAALEHSNSVDVNDDALEAELALALELADEDEVELADTNVSVLVEQESESESEEE